MPALTPFSIRLIFAKPARDAGAVAATVENLAAANPKIAKAITLGMQKLAFQAQKERFTGQGPFPVAQKRLGNVSGRLKRDLHSEPATITTRGYRARIGAAVEYFGAHEVGFDGNVSVSAHTRKAHTIRKRNMSRLEQSVRAHTRHMKITPRMPLRAAIEEHAETILGAEISGAVKQSLS